jgi:uncharacterized protein YbaR (Trm112 family)
MVDPEILKMLRCPETGQPVKLAEADTLKGLNEKIRAGQAQNRTGTILEAPLEAGLVREDGRLLFPVRENIPVMLVEEAIPL